MNSAEEHQEIIIIKRHGDHEDGHHGGAWKIAFADFMTAMMALFLVLWLVNAANEETKKAVASYFNPVKLVDRNRSVRGLYDAQGMQEVQSERVEGDRASAGASAEDGGLDGEAEGIGQSGTSDEAFFADPYEALDQIVEAQVVAELAAAGGGDGDWQSASDGVDVESFLDPFAPERWSEAQRDEEVMPDIPLSGVNDMGELATSEPAPETPPTDALVEGELGNVALTPEMREALGLAQADVDANAIDGPVDAMAELPPADIAEPNRTDPDQLDPQDRIDPVEAAAEELRDQVSEALREAFGTDSALPDQLTIEPRNGMVLISVTDNLEIPMFGIGSAVPSGPLVVALERIGGVVATRPGGIQIEGHTDARPFRSGEYDNWRLSAARAQSAFYMLVRGGLDENRIRKVSGLADRQLADPADPLGAVNRRIDILLEVDAQP